MCWSSRTTWRGVVRLARDRPEPSATRGRSPKPVIVRRTTAAPARVVPPRAELLAERLDQRLGVEVVRRAVGEAGDLGHRRPRRCSASGSAPAGVRPVAGGAADHDVAALERALEGAGGEQRRADFCQYGPPRAGAAAVEGQRAQRPDLARDAVALGRRAAQRVERRLVADHAARDLAQAVVEHEPRRRARPPGARRSWGRRRRAGRGCRSARRRGRRRRRRARAWSGGRRRRRASARWRSCRASRRTPGVRAVSARGAKIVRPLSRSTASAPEPPPA